MGRKKNKYQVDQDDFLHTFVHGTPEEVGMPEADRMFHAEQIRTDLITGHGHNDAHVVLSQRAEGSQKRPGSERSQKRSSQKRRSQKRPGRERCPNRRSQKRPGSEK